MCIIWQTAGAHGMSWKTMEANLHSKAFAITSQMQINVCIRIVCACYALPCVIGGEGGRAQVQENWVLVCSVHARHTRKNILTRRWPFCINLNTIDMLRLDNIVHVDKTIEQWPIGMLIWSPPLWLCSQVLADLPRSTSRFYLCEQTYITRLSTKMSYIIQLSQPKTTSVNRAPLKLMAKKIEWQQEQSDRKQYE